MKRRDFLGVLGAALASNRAFAQSRKPPTVGYLGGGSHAAASWTVDALREGLRAEGLVEGRDYSMEARFADGVYDRLAQHARELVAMPIAVLATGGTPATQAAGDATSSIPIVMLGVGDPVDRGFVKSLARPDRNITGVTNVGGDTTVKRIELLADLAPTMRRLGYFYNPRNANFALGMKTANSAAAASGKLEIVALPVATPADIDAAFAKPDFDGVFLTVDAFLNERGRQIAPLALAHRLPSVGGLREYVQSGGLLSYGADLAYAFRAGAPYVAKLLHGAKPADLPVQQPTRLELWLNESTAKALRITIAPDLRLRADQIVS